MNTKQDPVSRHSADGWGVPRSRTVHWNDPLPTAAAGATMSGVEYLQAMLDGKLPRAPISALVGITAGEIQDGQVTFYCTPDESTYNPIGTVRGGLLCTLLDSVTACAVHSTLPAGTAYSSLEIKVSYLRAASARLEPTGVGRVTRRGRRVSLAEGEIRDPQGPSRRDRDEHMPDRPAVTGNGLSMNVDPVGPSPTATTVRKTRWEHPMTTLRATQASVAARAATQRRPAAA